MYSGFRVIWAKWFSPNTNIFLKKPRNMATLDLVDVGNFYFITALEYTHTYVIYKYI